MLSASWGPVRTHRARNGFVSHAIGTPKCRWRARRARWRAARSATFSPTHSPAPGRADCEAGRWLIETRGPRTGGQVHHSNQEIEAKTGGCRHRDAVEHGPTPSGCGPNPAAWRRRSRLGACLKARQIFSGQCHAVGKKRPAPRPRTKRHRRDNERGADHHSRADKLSFFVRYASR